MTPSQLNMFWNIGLTTGNDGRSHRKRHRELHQLWSSERALCVIAIFSLIVLNIIIWSH